MLSFRIGSENLRQSPEQVIIEHHFLVLIEITFKGAI